VPIYGIGGVHPVGSTVPVACTPPISETPMTRRQEIEKWIAEQVAKDGEPITEQALTRTATRIMQAHKAQFWPKDPLLRDCIRFNLKSLLRRRVNGEGTL
jgi:hypothetical protein